jgi:predicted ATP-grasp superfamily ATP-dependent carboligase
MNMYYSGLAIARDLAGAGIKVVGLSSDRRIYGNFTRFCDVRFAPSSQAEPQQLAEYLTKASDELRGAVIFPTRDTDVVFLDHYRDQLKDYCLSIPSRQALNLVLNKGELARAAETAGVPVPKTITIHNADELELVPKEIGFPCVVKPVSAHLWHGGGRWETVGCRKAFRVDEWEVLRKEYAQVAAASPEVLVQEWIPGSSNEIVIMGGYFGANSNALGYFCARKLVQEPEDFGTGCLVQNLPLEELVEPSLRLCKSLGYRGMAEIEYKYDTAAREYKLIEINARHWDWHQLAHMSGVNLTRLAYSDLTGHQLDASTSRKNGGKWIAEDAFMLHAAAAIYNKQVKLRTLFRQLSGPKMFAIFAWDDPLPFLRYSLGSMLPGMGKLAWAKIRNRNKTLKGHGFGPNTVQLRGLDSSDKLREPSPEGAEESSPAR